MPVHSPPHIGVSLWHAPGLSTSGPIRYEGPCRMSDSETGSTHPATDPPTHRALLRDLGTFGATMMGLGSIVGTGVFVSIGIAAGIAGPAVMLAIAAAAALATCNALNSAQLAANHPVSGGTYEYGYRYLRPGLAFIAGWMFLCAKSASAATAALGFSGYLLNLTGLADRQQWLLPAVAVAAVAGLTLLVAGGIRRSSAANVTIVSITLLALLIFIVTGTRAALDGAGENLLPFFRPVDGRFGPTLSNVLHASALMFVAYTGYGRIATLGEEVREPRRTIPRAIVITLVVSMLLYLAVGLVAVSAVGSEAMHRATQQEAAPLEVVARGFGVPGVHWVVSVGAMTAMLGVLLNLILGLSRTLLAMGRRGDMPAAVARLSKDRPAPTLAVIVVGGIVAALALIGNVRTTWSLSAFTVLIYYAITNLAALRLPAGERLFSPAFAWMGLVGCTFLAFWVEWKIWVVGLAVILIGLAWQQAARRFAGGGASV
jgi:basic amino acid/polyamine antiporter, APA family